MISLIALAVFKPSEDPVERFDQFMRTAKSVSVDLELKVSASPAVGKGRFLMTRPGHLLYKMKWGPSDYSFSITPQLSVTIEHADKVYREYGAIGRFFIPENDISRSAEYGLPIPLLAGQLNALVPVGVSMKSGPKSTHAGATVDTAIGNYATQTSRVTVTAKIDSAGRLVQYETVHRSGSQTLSISLAFDNYRINPDLMPADFETPLPNGYVPESLPPGSYPLNVGERFSTEGWRPLSDGPSLRDLAAGKPLFLAISDVDCEVSQRSALMVDQLAKQIAAKGGASAALSLSSSPSQAPIYRSIPNFYEPNGTADSRLRAPGTPMFLLVSPKGVVRRVWLGFDNSKSGAFVSDVLEWLTKPEGETEPAP